LKSAKHHLNSPTILITGARGFTGLYLKDAAQKSGLKALELTSNLNDIEALEKEVLAGKT
jgi:GDP-6-deoxy-D-talose 4-dehydrogenase